MEGDDSQPPAWVQTVHGGGEHLFHGGQLVVDGDADGLEAPLGRVLLFPQSLGGMAPRMISASSSVVSMGFSARRFSMAAAMRGA